MKLINNAVITKCGECPYNKTVLGTCEYGNDFREVSQATINEEIDRKCPLQEVKLVRVPNSCSDCLFYSDKYHESCSYYNKDTSYDVKPKWCTINCIIITKEVTNETN